MLSNISNTSRFFIAPVRLQTGPILLTLPREIREKIENLLDLDECYIYGKALINLIENEKVSASPTWGLLAFALDQWKLSTVREIRSTLC
ncbi:MAG: hypothetical protein ON057_001938 [Glomeribacter sp. 1016415]|nr:hypothetical protein [Glomeribacter sp. 1016415]